MTARGQRSPGLRHTRRGRDRRRARHGRGPWPSRASRGGGRGAGCWGSCGGRARQRAVSRVVAQVAGVAEDAEQQGGTGHDRERAVDELGEAVTVEGRVAGVSGGGDDGERGQGAGDGGGGGGGQRKPDGALLEQLGSDEVAHRGAPVVVVVVRSRKACSRSLCCWEISEAKGPAAAMARPTASLVAPWASTRSAVDSSAWMPRASSAARSAAASGVRIRTTVRPPSSSDSG